MLKEHFGILESDSRQVVAERLGDHSFLGLTIGLPPPGDLHPLVARERLHDSWVDFLDELVAERPTVMLIEDVHWAEDDLSDLLETLVSQVEGPLLLLATARPELLDRRPGFAGRQSGSRLELEALPPAGAGRLLDELLGVELRASLREVLVERAEGNPCFVEELVATLIDMHVLRRENGGWSVGELPSDFQVPDSVQAVLAARIDLLPADEKAALQAAAVIGRIFWTGPVYELVGGGRPDLSLLEDRDFVRRRVGSSIVGEREYAIKHALTREVAYASLPKAKRAQLHAAFAGWLKRNAERDDEHTALLAYHYLAAVRPEDADLAWVGQDDQLAELRQQAVIWARRAAALALGRYEVDEAIALLHEAVKLVPDPAGQAALWQEIGHANAFKFDGEAFWVSMQKAIELTGPPADLYTELALQTVRRTGMWTTEPVRALVDEWIERAFELTVEGSSTHARALAAVALWRKDEAAARALYAIAERLGDVGLLSNALAALADVAWGAGDLVQSHTWMERRLELLPEISDPDDSHYAYMSAIAVDLATGRMEEARRAAALLVDMVEGLTPHHRLHGVGSLVRVESLMGHWDAVRSLTSRTEQAVTANVMTPCAGSARTLLDTAVASARGGDDAASRRLEAEADGLWMEAQRWRLETPQIRLALARNDLDELRRLTEPLDFGVSRPFGFDRAAALFDALVALGDREAIEAGAPDWLRPGTYVEPFALRALGFARADESMLTEAAGCFEGMELDWFAGETRKLLASFE